MKHSLPHVFLPIPKSSYFLPLIHIEALHSPADRKLRTECFSRLPEDVTTEKDRMTESDARTSWGWDWLPVSRGSDDYLLAVRLSVHHTRWTTSQIPVIVSQSSRGGQGLRDEVLSESVLISGCLNTFPSSDILILTRLPFLLLGCSNRAVIFTDDDMMGNITFPAGFPFSVWTVTTR